MGNFGISMLDGTFFYFFTLNRTFEKVRVIFATQFVMLVFFSVVINVGLFQSLDTFSAQLQFHVTTKNKHPKPKKLSEMETTADMGKY